MDLWFLPSTVHLTILAPSYFVGPQVIKFPYSHSMPLVEGGSESVAASIFSGFHQEKEESWTTSNKRSSDLHYSSDMPGWFRCFCCNHRGTWLCSSSPDCDLVSDLCLQGVWLHHWPSGCSHGLLVVTPPLPSAGPPVLTEKTGANIPIREDR